MAWKGDASAVYSGASGQMAVMAELLDRKCNVAIPQVDVGTDVFAFRDEKEDMARVQVKTALGKRYKTGRGFRAKFVIPRGHLGRADYPPLFYALAVRLNQEWGCFLVVSRIDLQRLRREGLGTENQRSGDVELNVQFRPGQAEQGAERPMSARCGTFDLSEYVNAWRRLPPLAPPPAL